MLNGLLIQATVVPLAVATAAAAVATVVEATAEATVAEVCYILFPMCSSSSSSQVKEATRAATSSRVATAVEATVVVCTASAL